MDWEPGNNCSIRGQILIVLPDGDKFFVGPEELTVSKPELQKVRRHHTNSHRHTRCTTKERPPSTTEYRPTSTTKPRQTDNSKQ